MYETTIVDPWKVCPICNKSYKGYHNCNEHTPADMPQIAHFAPSTSNISINKKEEDKLIGFVFVGNDTWQPKQLYIARKKQRQKTARQAKTEKIWQVKPSIQIG